MAFRNKKRERELSFTDENFGDQSDNNSNNRSPHGYHNPDYNPRNFWREHEYERQDFDDMNDRNRGNYEGVLEDFDYENSRMRTEANNFVSRRRNRESFNPNLRGGAEEEGYQGRNQEDYIGDYGSGTYYKPGNYDPGDVRNDYYYDTYSEDTADRDDEYEYFESVPSYHRRESRERSYLNPLYANANAFPEGRYSTSRHEFENWGESRKKNTRDERLENYRRRRPNIRENRN